MYALFTTGAAQWSLYGPLAADGPVLVANLDHPAAGSGRAARKLTS